MAGVAVVLGSGRSLWADLRAIQAITPTLTYFAVNYAVLFSPRADHAVSHHPDELPHLLALRARGIARGTDVPVTHSSGAGPGIDHAWPQFRGGRSGSSALLATQIALELGHEAVIVAGVPLDANGYVWGDPFPGAPICDFARFRQGWQDARASFAGRVTAVSGYLADLLGRPAPVCSDLPSQEVVA